MLYRECVDMLLARPKREVERVRGGLPGSATIPMPGNRLLTELNVPVGRSRCGDVRGTQLETRCVPLRDGQSARRTVLTAKPSGSYSLRRRRACHRPRRSRVDGSRFGRPATSLS